MSEPIQSIAQNNYILATQQEVSHDNTLSGNGTVDSPLGVVPGYNETVLWSGNLTHTNFSAEQNFSESITNFERVRFNWKIDGYCGSVECPANSGILSVPYFWKISAGYNDIRLTISANGDKWKFNDSIRWQTSTGSYSVTQFLHNWAYSMIPVREIIGINRRQ